MTKLIELSSPLSVVARWHLPYINILFNFKNSCIMEFYGYGTEEEEEYSK